ncbi:hypothetical protein HHI36_019144 [Cryptolaemus montrouzieri]|uniref:Uncharacterized protein n=1 Tax=Cryptolaemus montrouzieri TaxID=559131 RepID=A0ABD2P200_9CUCU
MEIQTNYNETVKNRKPNQGTVLWHLFPSSKGYGHVGLLQDPECPVYIQQFLNVSKEWKQNHKDVKRN